MCKTLRIAIQMEALEAISTPSSHATLALIKEAHQRGYALFHYLPQKLAFDEGQVVASGGEIIPDTGTKTGFVVRPAAQKLALATMDVVLMRQDPPFDMHYITAAHLLHQLEPAVWVLNAPMEVCNAPEKLFPLAFPDLIPPTVVTENIADIEAFLAQHHDIIVKPLYAYGGKGIMRFKHGDSNVRPATETLLAYSGAPVVAQRTIPEFAQGDKRILLVDGEVIGVFLRTPEGGDHRGNLSAGGSLHAVELTTRDKEISAVVGKELKKRGLFLAGLDVIGNYLTEINVTSPMGFAQLDQLYGINSAGLFWDKVQRALASR